jgi:hypothetical protein
MALYDGSHHVSIRVSWVDDELIEIEAELVAEGWCGRANTYTTADEIREFAVELAQFNRTLSGEARLEAGGEDGIGLVALRLYTIDAARHVACHVRLAAMASGHRPEQVHRLAIELTTEPSFIERFAKGLENIANSRTGEAVLVTE